MKKLIWFLTFFLSFFWRGGAQDQEALLAQLEEDDRSALEALVLYPEDTRLAILQAAQHPEALIRLESMQSRTKADFEDLVSPYDQEVQEMIWDVTRYPGLVERLVVEGQQSGARIRDLLDDYPDAVHERAMRGGTEYYRLLERVYTLQLEAEDAFEALLSDYDPATREALRTLIELPEVLDILTDNIRLTVLIGDLYRRDPEWLLQKADSLNLVVAQEQAKEYRDWKESVENDPQTQEELIASAEAFAEEYGYDDEYYGYDDDLYYEEPERVVIERHYYYHYPYWWGYPTWYLYPRWRPLPWWYDWGFYFGPGHRTVVVVGLPSFYFTNWYFHYPYHHYYYPHLSARFVNYYYGHRRSTGSIVLGVDRWKQRNRDVVRDDWLAESQGRVERLREYGRLEKERLDYNSRHPGRELSAPEYLDRHSSNYPRLRQVVPAAPRATDRAVQPPERRTERDQAQPRTEPRITRPDATDRKIPSRTEPRTVKPDDTDRKVQPPERSRERTTPQRQQPSREEIQRIEKAREHHKQQWERQRREPKVSPSRQTTTPKKQTTPPKSTTPTRKKKQNG